MGGEHGAYGLQGQMYTNEESELVTFRHLYWRYKKMTVVALVDGRESWGLRKRAERDIQATENGNGDRNQEMYVARSDKE
jgi:pantothenate kinase-related protein Tda10